jgi:hypothetical protein
VTVISGHLARDKDGFARIGVSLFELRGIRFIEGEDGGASDTENNDTENETETVDISVYEAKIAELNQAIADRDAQIATLTAEVTAAKAANYDLLNTSPVNDIDAGDELTPEVVDILPENLFGKDED